MDSELEKVRKEEQVKIDVMNNIVANYPDALESLNRLKPSLTKLLKRLPKASSQKHNQKKSWSRLFTWINNRKKKPGVLLKASEITTLLQGFELYEKILQMNKDALLLSIGATVEIAKAGVIAEKIIKDRVIENRNSAN